MACCSSNGRWETRRNLSLGSFSYIFPGVLYLHISSRKKWSKNVGRYMNSVKYHLRKYHFICSVFRRHLQLREKCPYSELFWFECGKIRTRITRNKNIFHTVYFLNLGCLLSTESSHILKQTCSFQLELCLKILTGKKHPWSEAPALTKYVNLDICVVGTLKSTLYKWFLNWDKISKKIK